MSEVSIPDPLRPSLRQALAEDARSFLAADPREVVAESLACSLALDRLAPDVESGRLAQALRAHVARLDREEVVTRLPARLDVAGWERDFLVLIRGSDAGGEAPIQEAHRLLREADVGRLALLAAARTLDPPPARLEEVERGYRQRVADRLMLRVGEPPFDALAPLARAWMKEADPALGARDPQLAATLDLYRALGGESEAAAGQTEPTTVALSFDGPSGTGGLGASLSWGAPAGGLSAHLELSGDGPARLLLRGGDERARAAFEKVRVFGVEGVLERGQTELPRDRVRAAIYTWDGPHFQICRRSGSWESWL